MKMPLFYLLLLSFAGSAAANTVQVSVNKPMTIDYRIAYQSPRNAPVLGGIQTITVQQHTTIAVPLSGYKYVRFIPVSIAGPNSPSSVTQFSQPQKCSVVTDAKNKDVKLDFVLTAHSVSCKAVWLN